MKATVAFLAAIAATFAMAGSLTVNAAADALPIDTTTPGFTMVANFGFFECAGMNFYTRGNVPELFGNKPTPGQPPPLIEPPPTSVRYIDRWDVLNNCDVPIGMSFGLRDGSWVTGKILPGTDLSLDIQDLKTLGIRFQLGTEWVADSESYPYSGPAVPDFVLGP